MNILIVYFSGTGNTWWVCSELKKSLDNSGNQTTMISLENAEAKNTEAINKLIDQANCIIAGFPIYGSDTPDIMTDFINNLPECRDNKQFCALCTQAAFSGDGSIFFRKTVEEKGYSFRQCFQFNMTTNFNVAMPPFSFSKPASGRKLQKMRDKTLRKIARVTDIITSDKKHFEGSNPLFAMIGHIQRFFFRKNRGKLLTKFQFIKERCTGCKLCEKSCPVDSISFDDETGELIRNDNCILCFRCYNFCPALAINFGNKVTHPEKYKRFTGPVENMKLFDIMK